MTRLEERHQTRVAGVGNPSLPHEQPDFDQRWAMWQARGRAREAGWRRRIHFVIGLTGVGLIGWFLVVVAYRG
jgi:hypothetical protein